MENTLDVLDQLEPDFDEDATRDACDTTSYVTETRQFDDDEW
jgi:hypothetical protein